MINTLMYAALLGYFVMRKMPPKFVMTYTRNNVPGKNFDNGMAINLLAISRSLDFLDDDLYKLVKGALWD